MVNWVPGGKFLTSCQLDITYYPFDDQSCNIDLVDWAYHGLQVKLMNGSSTIGLDAYTQSGEWSITTTTASSADQYYESDPGVPFPRVRFTMKLRRKPMFYLINIITPCTMMSLLAVLVFSLPPDSGEKVSLGITVLLSFSVFLLLVAENVPKTSENVPLLGIYLTLIMGMTALSILFCVIVLNLHHEDKNRPVPTWLRYLHRCMACVVGGTTMKSNRLNKMNSHSSNDKYCSCSHDKRTRSNGGVYSINGVHSDSCGVHKSRGALSRLLDCGANSSGTSPSHNSTATGSTMTGGGCSSRRSDSAHQHGVAGGDLDEVLKHLRTITDRLRDAEEQENIRAQWKMLARMLDRLFLLVFIMIIVLSTFSLLVLYPLLGRV